MTGSELHGKKIRKKKSYDSPEEKMLNDGAGTLIGNSQRFGGPLHQNANWVFQNQSWLAQRTPYFEKLEATCTG
jgi:hypothetical protein